MEIGHAAAGSGTLVLIVGPSGAGKDSLIAYCRKGLGDDPSFVFPRRIVTRPPGDASEDHLSLSAAAFVRAARRGAFALHWSAHDLSYGIPATIEDDLRAGRTVIVNVSRTVIDAARQRYSRLLTISVTAPQEILAERIRGRGREDDAASARRVASAGSLVVSGRDVVEIDNSRPLEVGGETLMALLGATRMAENR